MRNFLLTVFLVVVLFVMGACAGGGKAEEGAVTIQPQDEIGETARGFSHTDTKSGKVDFKVEGDAVSGFGSEKVTIDNPKIEKFFYEEDKENSLEVKAQTGVWDKKSGQIKMDEEVEGVVRFEENIIIEHADKMDYDPSTNILILSGNVRIKRARSLLNADKVTVHLAGEGKEITRIAAEGNVSGRIFTKELNN